MWDVHIVKKFKLSMAKRLKVINQPCFFRFTDLVSKAHNPASGIHTSVSTGAQTVTTGPGSYILDLGPSSRPKIRLLQLMFLILCSTFLL